MKKAVIAFISLMLILLIFPTTASAEENSYEPRLTAPSSSNAYYNRKLNRYSQTGYGMPNCVAYAYGRVYEMNGEAPKITHGSAGDWWGINKRGDYYDYGQTPKLGAVAVWSGHVAVVEKINDGGSIVVSESHYRGKYFNTKTISNYKSHYGQKFYGFIYTYKEKAKEDEPQYKMTVSVATPNETPKFNVISSFGEINNDNIVHNDKMLIATM